MAELYDWQKPLADRAEKALRGRGFDVLATCTGSGKSFIAAEVARRLGRPVLVICPKAAKTQFTRCLRAMGAGDLLLDVLNPSKLIVSRKQKWYNPSSGWAVPEGTLVIFDEIHRGCSGRESKATVACARLKAYGASLLAMSATAACTPLQMRALAYWAGVAPFEIHGFMRWCRANGVYDIQRPTRYGVKKVPMFTRNRKRAAEIMRGIRASFGDAFQSLGPDEIPGFPDEVLETLYIDLDAGGRKAVDEAYAEMSARVKSDCRDSLAQMTRERERVEFTLARPLAEKAAADAEDGISPVVFFNFTEPRLRFEAGLRKLGCTAIASIHGNQKEGERQDMIDAFNRNALTVASVNTAAGGAALSLHDVLHERQRVSYIIPSFNAADVKQALGRIRRVGGTAVVQRFVIAAGTLMERVGAALDGKLGNIDALNDLTNEDLVI